MGQTSWKYFINLKNSTGKILQLTNKTCSAIKQPKHILIDSGVCCLKSLNIEALSQQ
jgi:hypothetical protein